MAWVVDKGLLKLISQVNAAAPDRSKASDGTIGDLAHQQGASDHNPQDPAPAGNPASQVDAADLTHDPARGADMGIVTESIRTSRDRRVSYVIFNRRIFSGPEGPSPFVWRAYTGTSDPHTNHAHVSVRDATHDQIQPWQIGIDMPTVKEVWETDDIVPNRPWRPDFATNKFVKPETALVEAWDSAHEATAAVAAMQDKVMTALAALHAQIKDLVPLFGAVPGTLTWAPAEAAPGDPQ